MQSVPSRIRCASAVDRRLAGPVERRGDSTEDTGEDTVTSAPLSREMGSGVCARSAPAIRCAPQLATVLSR